ncbi:hypothetical protein F5Y16DRAFT_394718 [Xylariaceae sp. FL0255]|nr:hypothetical protein F5Y16DRAFT_394718 [Xylariaceae sp. FL0255]
MGLERRLSRASPNTIVSLDAVVNASCNDLRTDEPVSSAPLAPATIPPSSQTDVDQEEQGTEDDREVPGTPSSCISPPPLSETFETRSVRSTSSASRNANRLSLTLPIALPNGMPSRPIPTASMPPTPVDTSALNSPVDSNDMIIAIAAQERRVFELREELNRAEAELRRLQRQWTINEGCKKRPNRTTEPLRDMTPIPSTELGPDGTPIINPVSEMERRKTILLAQSQNNIPRVSKRTVIRGGHTRTLSLLSPTKSSAGDVSIHEDSDVLRSPESIRSPLPNIAPLSKRATWAPRQSQQSASGVKQLANDFKQGLWTFVEDIRQATVGDEGVSGTTSRTSDMSHRLERTDGGEDTIRASTTNRGRIPFPADFDEPDQTPSRSSTGSFSDRFQHRRTASRPEPRARKHFSWTPLSFENLDDEDWSNWDSPNVKSARWSGSTVNGDIVPAIPERDDEHETTLRRKRSRNELRSTSPKTPGKLEELPQAILNRFTPSNIKTTLKDWERSLSPPADSTSYESGLRDFTHSTQ